MNKFHCHHLEICHLSEFHEKHPSYTSPCSLKALNEIYMNNNLFK